MTLEEMSQALDQLPWEEAQVSNWDELTVWVTERLKAQQSKESNE